MISKVKPHLTENDNSPFKVASKHPCHFYLLSLTASSVFSVVQPSGIAGQRGARCPQGLLP